MFIIWGTRPTEKYLGNTSERYHCTHCNNDNYFNVKTYKEWFTLYFIPIFPFSIRRRVECPICEYGYEITKDKAIKILNPEENT